MNWDRDQESIEMNTFVALDCEGPITLNDNAFELAREYIPGGDRFFSNISKYDDFLADVLKRPGYKAGDTLKLILPFFRAFDMGNEVMTAFSEKTLALVPGAKGMLAKIQRLSPAFIVSTSYKPYLQALSRLTGFPLTNVYCTEVDLSAYTMTERDKKTLKAMAEEIASMPMLSWPHDADGVSALAPPDKEIFARLEEIFWKLIPSMDIGRIYEDVNPVGGHEKALSLDHASQRTGIGKDCCLYAGDSITDVEVFGAVREAGGVTIAFNGNSYALRSAQFALIAPTAGYLDLLIHGFVDWGPGRFKEVFSKQEYPLSGHDLIDMLDTLGLDKDGMDEIQKYRDETLFYCLNDENLASAVNASERMRRQVRGAQIGGLG